MILMESSIKEPNDFFRQYRNEFKQTQQADGTGTFKLKKCDEEREALQQIDISSQVPIQLDRIGISPLQNSNISFSQKNVPSDINPIKQLGPYSNQLGSDQLNDQNERGSHMQMQSRINYQLELDYSSINPESQQGNNLSDLKNPPIQSIVRAPAEKHVSLKLDEVFEKDDLEKLYDYSSSSASSSEEQQSESQQSSVKIMNLTMKERLKKSFLRHLTFTKIESMSIQHTVRLLESQYHLINDLAADVSFAKLQNSSYGFSIFFQKITSIFPSFPSIPVLPPSSRICILLDLSGIVFYSVCLMFLSLQLFLNAGVFKDNLIKRSNWIMPLTLVFFGIDFIKGLITPFYHKGIYQYNISTITARYLKSFCVFDLIPIIPLIGEFDQLSNYTLRVLLSLLYFSKLVTIRICIYRINISWGITDRNSLFRMVLKLFSYFFLLVHFLAILYHGISLIEIDSGYDSDITWLKRYDLIQTNDNIRDNNVWERYLRSLFSTASCISASATLEPRTKLEQIFNLFMTFVSLMVFAFFLNEVHDSVKANSKSDFNLQEKKKKLNNYMDQMNVPALLQGKVSNYFDYFQQQTSRFTSLDMANDLMEKLHGELREELTYATRNYYVPYFSQFLSSFSKETVNNTYSIIEELQFQPGDVIFHEGQYSQSAVYAIVSGQIEIYHTRYPSVQNSQFYGSTKTRFTHLAYLKSHEMFGDISFITNLPHSASARCTELSTVVKIDRQKFIDLIKENNQEEDFEMLCMLRDDVIFKKNYRAIHARCWSCNRYGHLAKSCKLIHFYPLKSHIINTRTSNYKQQREEFPDRKKRMGQIPIGSLEPNHKKFVEDFNDEITDYVEKHFPGQSNLSDYLPSSHSATTANQQSSNTEILTTDKINEHEKHIHAHLNSGSGLELPLPFNAPNHKSSTNTLNESSMIRQAAGSSKARHKDSLDSDMGIKGRKDSAQTKNSNDSAMKPKNSNRSLNAKKESPLEIVMKVSDQATDTYNIRKSSDASQQLTETIQRDKTLKSQLTRGTQKTNKSNKSSSSIYRNKFDHSVVIPQRIDSRASSISTSPHKHSPTQQQDNPKNLVSSTSKQSIQNNTPSVGGSGGAGLLGSSYEETEIEQNQSYELVLPKIELVVNNNIIPKPHQLELSPEHEHRSNISSVNLDQHSSGSKSETNLIAGISSPYVESQFRPYSMNSSLLEFDCMKNFKVYNTQNNLKIVLESTSPTKTRHPKRARKKVTIIES